MEFTPDELEVIKEALLDRIPKMIEPHKTQAATAVAKIRIKERQNANIQY